MTDTDGHTRPQNNFFALLKAVVNALYARNVSLIAAGVAFYSMFAIFPGMVATIALWGIFADPVVVEQYLQSIKGLLPNTAEELISTQLHELIVTHSSGWNWATLLPLGLSLYSIHNAVLALMSGISAVQSLKEPATGWARLMSSLLMTLALLAIILLALATVVILPIVMRFFPMGVLGGLLVRFVPWIILFLVVKLVLGLFYRFGPGGFGADGKADRDRWFSPGSIIAAFLWALASFAFSLYLENFNNYNRIYGSIGAVIALMTWIYLSAYIMLLGAVVNAEIARMKLSPQ